MSQPASQAPPPGDQYNLDDSAPTQAQATPPPAPAPTDVTPEPASRQLPPRDPASGQFVKPHTHPARLVRTAAQLGFTDAQMAEMDTASLIQEVQLAAVERQFNQTSATVAQHQDSNPVPANEPIALEKDEFDPKLVGVVERLVKRIETLEQNLGGFVRAHATQTLVQQADTFFAKHADLFGKGTIDDVVRGSPEAERRMLIFDKAKSMDGPEPFVAKLEKARAIYFGAAKAAPPPAAEKPAASPRITQEQWDQAGLVRPTHRANANEPDGPAKAAETIRRHFQENGMADGPPTFKDEFPG